MNRKQWTLIALCMAALAARAHAQIIDAPMPEPGAQVWVIENQLDFTQPVEAEILHAAGIPPRIVAPGHSRAGSLYLHARDSLERAPYGKLVIALDPSGQSLFMTGYLKHMDNHPLTESVQAHVIPLARGGIQDSVVNTRLEASAERVLEMSRLADQKAIARINEISRELSSTLLQDRSALDSEVPAAPNAEWDYEHENHVVELGARAHAAHHVPEALVAEQKYLRSRAGQAAGTDFTPDFDVLEVLKALGHPLMKTEKNANVRILAAMAVARIEQLIAKEAFNAGQYLKLAETIKSYDVETLAAQVQEVLPFLTDSARELAAYIIGSDLLGYRSHDFLKWRPEYDILRRHPEAFERLVPLSSWMSGFERLLDQQASLPPGQALWSSDWIERWRALAGQSSRP